MRIVNLKEFLAMPEGTLFAKYRPSYFEDMQIKGENIGARDFGVYEFGPDAIECSSSEEWGEKLDEAEQDSSLDLKLDLDCCGRDGFFNDGQLFAVFSSADIEALMARLGGCLQVAKAKELG